MSDLRRIVPPGKRPDRWLRASVAIVALFVFIALAKPWGSGGPLRVPFPIATAAATPAASSHGLTRGAYDPALFGQEVPDPAWQLWPAGYVVDFGLAGPLTIDPPTPATTPGASGAPVATQRPSPASPFGPSEPVRLGGADNLVVLGVNNPDDVHVDAIRLWRYDGHVTRRVSVSSLRSPWPTEHFHVIGMPSNDTTDGLGPWQPGVYRLDLLTAPTGAIRSIVLSVDPPSNASPSPPVVGTPPDPPTLPDPPAGAIALLGPDGSGIQMPADARDEVDPSCELAALWLGETAAPGTRCAPIPITGIAAIAFGPGARIHTVELRSLDPIARDVPVSLTRAPSGGVIVTTVDRVVVNDGFYELTMTAAGGNSRHWYLDVIAPPP
ncbi:MAG: hypothetical protein ACJ77B_08475 [Chloroflexota bacterium]